MSDRAPSRQSRLGRMCEAFARPSQGAPLRSHKRRSFTVLLRPTGIGAARKPARRAAQDSSFALPQHADQHPPKRPVLLAVDQELEPTTPPSD
jgi:hypothetical protein